MAVILSPPQKSPKKGWSVYHYLMSTETGPQELQELLTIAAKMGLKYKWLHKAHIPHFDIKGMMIERATKCGATTVSDTQFKEIVRNKTPNSR